MQVLSILILSKAETSKKGMILPEKGQVPDPLLKHLAYQSSGTYTTAKFVLCLIQKLAKC